MVVVLAGERWFLFRTIFIGFRQRVRNTQPDGGLIGEGKSPSSNSMDLLRSNFGSGIGTADIKALV